MGIAKVTRNYQVTIPRDVRVIQGISEGDTVLFVIEGNKVDFLKIEKEKIIEETAGSWKGVVKESSIEYVRQLRKGWAKRAKRLGI